MPKAGTMNKCLTCGKVTSKPKYCSRSRVAESNNRKKLKDPAEESSAGLGSLSDSNPTTPIFPVRRESHSEIEVGATGSEPAAFAPAALHAGQQIDVPKDRPKQVTLL